MPWLIGIDEAGYGPNLGPFVASMAMIHHEEREPPDPWTSLRSVVRRAGKGRDARLVVDDSKAVHVPGQGLAALERNLCPFLWESDWPGAAACGQVPLASLWRHCVRAPDLSALSEETWFVPEVGLPRTPHLAAELATRRADLRQAFARSQTYVRCFVSIVVFPRQFNAIVDQCASKGAVATWAIQRLLRFLPRLEKVESPSRVVVDKLGGRDDYHPCLQEAFPDCLVMVRERSSRRSRYVVPREGATWEITFEPRADQGHFAVALASMMSKYVRELLMEQFNAFWRRHVPDLKPTAGYPMDAQRFYRAIDPARRRLGMADEALWRKR